MQKKRCYERALSMLDIHSHILPGIDDGSKNFEETETMLRAAARAGITSIVATPHFKAQQTYFSLTHDIFVSVKPFFERQNITLRLGCEFNIRFLMEGFDEDIHSCCIEGTNVLLLELSNSYLPMQWENFIYDLQQKGIDVIIAHPERCVPIQQDVSIAERMTEIGCELQLSAGSLFSGVLSKERRCAQTMLREGLVGYIASDAHCTQDYLIFKRSIEKYGNLVSTGSLLA